MIVLRLFAIFALIAINAFFAAVEFSLVAVRHSRVRQLVEQGDSRARIVERLIADMGMVISGVQVGITLTSLALGYLGEVTLANFLAPFFCRRSRTLRSHRRTRARASVRVCVADGFASRSRRAGAEKLEPGSRRARCAAGGAAVSLVPAHISLGHSSAQRHRRKIRGGSGRENVAEPLGRSFRRRAAYSD